MYSIVWKIAERAEKYSGRDGKKLFLIINTLLWSLAASVLAAAVSVIGFVILAILASIYMFMSLRGEGED